LPEGGDITFTNFVDLMDQLAKKPDIYNCFATQYLSYATGRGIQEIDPCERTNLLAAFAQSGYRVDSLVVSLVTSPAFTTRKN
jgi:membrane peptidoglycan carboxypeptidase